MPEGYVYCLTNESMPGLIKIGETHTIGKTPYDRAEDLYTTGVPTPFNVEFYAKTNDSKKLETDIHILLKEYRNSEKREFFKMSPYTAKLAIEQAMPDISLLDEIIISTSSENSKYNDYNILKEKYDIIENNVIEYIYNIENSVYYNKRKVAMECRVIKGQLTICKEGLCNYKSDLDAFGSSKYAHTDNKSMNNRLGEIINMVEKLKIFIKELSSVDQYN
jgi:hypothetical protein